jgi:hypothetical protein
MVTNQYEAPSDDRQFTDYNSVLAIVVRVGSVWSRVLAQYRFLKLPL